MGTEAYYRPRMNGKRLIALAALASIAGALTQAAAADFRSLDFGQSCANVAALESAAGSAPHNQPLSGYSPAFRGVFMEREVIIGYSCSGDGLYRGAYIFAVKDEAEASSLYQTLKRRLVSEQGKPSYDFASQEHRQKMAAAGATLSRSDTEVAFWEKGSIEPICPSRNLPADAAGK